MNLGSEEFINQITCGHKDCGVTMLTFTTNTGRKLMVEGKLFNEEQTVTDINLVDENKVLAGLKTKFHKEIFQISCYTTEVNHANLDDILKEASVISLITPQTITKKMNKVKGKRKVIKK